MKKIFAFFIAFLMVLSLASCTKKEIKIEGEYITKEYSLGASLNLEIENIQLKNSKNNSFPNVEMVPALEPKIMLKAQENIFDYISVTNKNNTISIKGSNNELYLTDYITIMIYGYSFKKMDLACVNLEAITYDSNSLDLELSGASFTKTLNIICDDVSIELSGAIDFDAAIAASELDLDISGASKAKLTGALEKINADISGASSLNAKGLVIAEANLDVSGASNAEITFLLKLTADVSGASSLTYYGDSNNVSSDVSGASSCKKG